MTDIATKSLYQILGGRQAIAGVVSSLYDRLTSDSDSWYHWKGRTPAERETESRSFTDLVCIAAGGPAMSENPETENSNAGLDIKNVQWRTFVNLAAETLDEAGLDDEEKEQFYSALTRSKAEIGDSHDRPTSVTVFAVFPHALTQREREVLTLVAMGRNNSEIARELFISVNTVTRHVSNIFIKTSTKNRVEAAVYAAKRHLV